MAETGTNGVKETTHHNGINGSNGVNGTSKTLPALRKAPLSLVVPD